MMAILLNLRSIDPENFLSKIITSSGALFTTAEAADEEEEEVTLLLPLLLPFLLLLVLLGRPWSAAAMVQVHWKISRNRRRSWGSVSARMSSRRVLRNGTKLRNVTVCV
jgi:hypothetical protein